MGPTSIILGGILCVLAVIWAVTAYKMDSAGVDKTNGAGIGGAFFTFLAGISLSQLIDDLIKGESAGIGAFLFAIEFIIAIITFCEWVIAINKTPKE